MSNAFMLYNKGDFESALVAWYYDQPTKETLLIYFNYLVKAGNDMFLFKYYLLKCRLPLCHPHLTHDDEVVDIITQIRKRLLASNLPDKQWFSENLTSGRYMSFSFDYEYQITRGSNPDSAWIPEIVFEQGSKFVHRQKLNVAMSYYKELVQQRSPFQYLLYAQIHKLLKTFAHFEREAYNKYLTQLDNILEIDTPAIRQEPMKLKVDHKGAGGANHNSDIAARDFSLKFQLILWLFLLLLFLWVLVRQGF
jgi:hypothetical protein